MIHDQKAPILGRISMNLTVVDITGIPNVQTPDEAILLGDGVSADDHARIARTISYEILCGINPCN
jgi:alanine racemase